MTTPHRSTAAIVADLQALLDRNLVTGKHRTHVREAAERLKELEVECQLHRAHLPGLLRRIDVLEQRLGVSQP